MDEEVRLKFKEHDRAIRELKASYKELSKNNNDLGNQLILLTKTVSDNTEATKDQANSIKEQSKMSLEMKLAMEELRHSMDSFREDVRLQKEEQNKIKKDIEIQKDRVWNWIRDVSVKIFQGAIITTGTGGVLFVIYKIYNLIFN